MTRKWRALTIVVLIGIFLLTGVTSCGSSKAPKEIRVGGKNFSEQFIMAEMLSILIEENTDLKTSLQTNLASNVILNAIKSDQIDLYLEYTGTGLTSLGIEPMSDPDEVYETVKKEFDEQFNIKWMKPMVLIIPMQW